MVAHHLINSADHWLIICKDSIMVASGRVMFTRSPQLNCSRLGIMKMTCTFQVGWSTQELRWTHKLQLT